MIFFYVILSFTAIICTSGRSAVEYKQQGVGTDLYIQNGTDPIRNAIKIPHDQSDISSTQWTEGRCFPSMGMTIFTRSKKKRAIKCLLGQQFTEFKSFNALKFGST